MHVVAVLIPLALVSGCGTANAATTAPVSARCVAHGALPDPTCTPGATNPGVVQANIRSTICVREWTQTVRPPEAVTARIKTERMAAYGVPDTERATVELDHLVPLELGGAPNDLANLWPEVSDLPGAGFRNTKDTVERRLRHAVCTGRITLADAQHAIATDWTTADARLALR